MDRSGNRGPWTGKVLALVADRPGIVSTVLAEAMGDLLIEEVVAAMNAVLGNPVR